MRTQHVVDRFMSRRESVGCPIQGRDVEVDQCLSCARLMSARLDGEAPLIECDVPRESPHRWRSQYRIPASP